MKEKLKDTLTALACEGERIVYVDGDGDGERKTLWAGLGNRAGLHSFAFTLCNEKWKKSGERMLKKFDALPKGTRVIVQTYRNITRDKGRWVDMSVYNR